MAVRPGAEPWSHDGGPIGAVLCHGFSGSPASMRPWGEHLAAAGLTVRIPRLPGHGTRWQDCNATGWDDWYGTLSGALDDLRSRCDEVYAFGLSMGGALVLHLAAERGAQIKAFAVVNPALATRRKDMLLLPFLYRFVPAFPGISNDIRKPGQDEVAYDKTPLRALHSFSSRWPDLQAELPRITQPMIMFRSVEDHVVDDSTGPVVMATIGSAEHREVLLQNSYHVATLDNDAPMIFQESLDLIRRHTEVGLPPN